MWTLDEIVKLLKKHRQRATYGAVAGVLKKSAQGLMKGRQRCYQDSWVVAQTTHRERGSRRGCPTGYSDEEIDPVCLNQIRTNLANFIREADELKNCLRSWR